MYKSLIIDDERAVHVVIKKLGRWQEFGIQTPQSARNGDEGLTAMRLLKPDIVFVDMNMPVMSGSQFLMQASVQYPHTKFIVVSGYDDFRYAKTALQANALDYILKPVAENELNKVLSRAVELLNAEYGLHNSETETEDHQVYTPQTLPPALKNYIDGQYAHDLTLDQLSEKFLFTKEYLSRLFKKRYGCGIYEYVLQIRMGKAKKLLENGELQICQIAAAVGYNDSNYFSKAFRSFFSQTPSDYRNRFFSRGSGTGSVTVS